jgi:hypothetical protein
MDLGKSRKGVQGLIAGGGPVLPQHNSEFRRLAMIVLSKPIGAGALERNWADVKTV